MPSYRRVNDEPSTSNMYLDNFMKVPTERQRMDLDDYLSKRKSAYGENFVDDLEGNNL